jgi:hypothetical protein
VQPDVHEFPLVPLMSVVTVVGETFGAAPLTEVSVMTTESEPGDTNFGLRVVAAVVGCAGTTIVKLGLTSPLCGVVVAGVTGDEVEPPPPPLQAASATSIPIAKIFFMDVATSSPCV